MPRLTITMDRDIHDYFQKMAAEKRTDISGLIGQGLRVMQAAREQRKIGRSYLGFTSDPSKLDVQLIIV